LYAPRAVYMDPTKVMLPPTMQQPPPRHAMVMPPQQRALKKGDAGYHKVSYPHYLKPNTVKPKKQWSNKKKRYEKVSNSDVARKMNGAKPRIDAVAPSAATYFPFAHAGQSTPQMRTLHKIVWVLEHQKKAINVEAIRHCMPGKKKVSVKEIDYLLTSYESYKYTKSEEVSGRKAWKLCKDAFPAEFWNMHWQRTH